MASTKNTIPTNARARHILWVALLGAVFLLVYAGIINIQQAQRNLSYQPLITLLAKEQPLPAHYLQLPAQTIVEENLQVMALMTYALQQPLPERLKLMQQARLLQAQILAKAPADPYGWLRFAHLHYVAQGDAAVAFAALKKSIMVAPYQPKIMQDRANLWANLSAVQTSAEQKKSATLSAAALRAKRHIWD